jgi:serine phosphatase RsbU (regulator of sigma subunit)
MSVPIQMAGRIMGVLDVQSVNEAAFTQADLILVQSLADSVAVAIRNAALYANERRRRNLADALREVSATLASELDADRVLSGVLEGLRRVVSLDKAAILLFDEAINTLTVYATSGPGLEGFVGHRRQLDDLVADEAALENHIHALYRELLGIPDERPTIAVPLVVGGELIGFVVADRTYEWLQASTDYEMVGAFANQAAIAISNARLYAAQQAETYVTTVLLQVAEAANAQADLTAALDTIARLTALLAGVSRCLILRWDAGERTYSLVSQYGIPRERSARQSGKPIPASEHPLLEVLSVASIPLHAGKGQDLPLPEPLMGFLPDASVMCLPLRAKGEAVGLLVVDYPEKGENPRLLSILQGIAHQTATVLETAALQAIAVERERLEQELQVARTIQASFIPDSPPQVPGWQVSAIWRAARQVSGDFYDFIQLPDGCWGMVMADVADKGMPAALFMAVCRTLVRAAAVSRTSPAQTLSRVNALLFNDSRADLFVTVFYAIWNPSTGEVKYASAGHNPGLLVRGGSGEVIELRSRGLALGVIPQVELEEHSMSLEPGDALVSYTDGVTEAMQSDYTEWGLGRFKAALRSSGGLHSEAMLHLVLESIDDFVGGAPQSDDLTMWVLRRE